MNRIRAILIALAAAIIVVAWIGVLSIRTGIDQTSVTIDGIPAIFMAPQNVQNAPGVLIGHGFAGSKNLMLGYGYTMAQAGYVALLWDFAGHGANPNRMDDVPLQADVDTVYAALISHPAVDASRVGIMGHSRGSGAALAAAVRDPERFGAVVAVSPVNAEVTPTLPRNLMLQAGSLEAAFVANAERLLADAGGRNPDLSAGLGRVFQLIPNAEHISILFRPLSQQMALAWFDAAFGHTARRIITDLRVIWYVLHMLGWMLMLAAVAPLWRRGDTTQATVPSSWRPWIGLMLGPAAAIGLLWVVNRVIPVAEIGGVLVGGAVALWLAAAGVVWRATIGHVFFQRPTNLLRDLALGVMLFVVLSLAFGVMAPAVWLPWWLAPLRLALWPLLALGAFPWFLTVALVQERHTVWMRLLWWLMKSVVVVTGLILLLSVVPGLYILTLMAPLVPILFGLLDLANAAVRRPAAYALGSALFFGWVLAVVFPLAG